MEGGLIPLFLAERIAQDFGQEVFKPAVGLAGARSEAKKKKGFWAKVEDPVHYRGGKGLETLKATGRPVVIVEDIHNTGESWMALSDLLLDEGIEVADIAALVATDSSLTGAKDIARMSGKIAKFIDEPVAKITPMMENVFNGTFKQFANKAEISLTSEAAARRLFGFISGNEGFSYTAGATQRRNARASRDTNESQRDQGDWLGLTFSLGSADYLETIAQRLEAAKVDPLERLASFQRAADRLAGMARAVRFNDEQGVIKNLTRTGIEREQRILRVNREKELLQDIEARNPGMDELLLVTGLSENPLIDLLTSKRPGARRATSRIMSRSAALKRGKKVGGEYDGALDIPSFMFGGTESPDTLAQEAYENGLLKSPDTNLLWEGIAKAIAASRKGKKSYAKYKEERRAAREQAAEEAKDWADKQHKKQQGIDFEKREVERAMVALDTVLTQFPAEVRQMVGGFTPLARVQGNKARLTFFIDRVNKLERAMEVYLQREYTAQIRALVERSRPKGDKDKGQRIAGKIGAAAHDYFRQIEPMLEQSGEAVRERLLAIEVRLGEDNDPETQQELTDEWSQLQVFGNWRGKTALEMSTAFANAQQIYDTGRTGWRAVMDQRRADREALRGIAIADVGGTATRKAQDARAEERKKSPAATNVRGFLLQFFSFRLIGICFFRGALDWGPESGREIE